jgi:hypothetical protein
MLEAWALFKEDITYQITAGFSQVVLWDDIKRLQPRNLKFSSVALIPQEGCHGRIILDLSFPVYQEVDGVITVTQKSVNYTTVLSAPSIPVREIGKVLPQLLQYMRDTLAGLHILFSKLDISDGFWRLVVHDDDCFNFAYVLPQEAGEPVRLVIPAVVQMGWVESPGLVCTVTESTRDLTQHLWTMPSNCHMTRSKTSSKYQMFDCRHAWTPPPNSSRCMWMTFAMLLRSLRMVGTSP